MKKIAHEKISKNSRKIPSLAIWYILYFLIFSLAFYIVLNNPTIITPKKIPSETVKPKKAIKSSMPKYLITTAVGTGEAGYSGDNELATNAKINDPYGIAVSENGTLFISDRQNSRIRKVDPGGIISTFAGVGSSQIICTSEPISEAHIPGPEKLTLGADGSLYVSSSQGHRIRKIDNQGVVKVVAGTGDPGYNIDGIIATSSQLYSPGGTAVDAQGNLYIADTLNHRVRKVDPKGIISTIAGTGIAGFSGDNGPAIKAKIDTPTSVAISSDGYLYFSHGLNPRVRKISPRGRISTIAGTGTAGFSEDGTSADKARLSEWSSTVLGPDDTVYIVDHKNNRILYIDNKGFIRNLAGTGTGGFSGDNGNATEAMLGHPTQVAINKENVIFISDADNNRIRKLVLTPSKDLR